MKQLFILIIGLLTVSNLFAQTDGLSYQAVIINPKGKEIPGNNVSGNILVNTSVSVRFTISNSTGSIEFQEERQTTTDAYGMINLMIGQGNAIAGNFDEIIWDGSEKELTVEIKLNGNYVELSRQELLFVPYAFHRDIIASGDLIVEGSIDFSGNLEVQGTTKLNNSLTVDKQSPVKLSGALTVEGQAAFNDDINVDGATQLNNTLNVDGSTSINNDLKVLGQNSTDLSGNLQVEGETDLNNTLNVNNGSDVNISGNLNLDGATVLNSNLTVQGNTNLNDSLNVNNQSPATLTGSLNVGGAANLNNTLTVEGATILNKELNVTNGSASDLTGSLNVDGRTYLNSTLILDGRARLNNKLTVHSNSIMEGDLNVDGVTLLNDALTVTNGSPTHLTGTLSVDGAIDMKSNLNVDGPLVVDNTLQVINGNSTQLSGTLNVDDRTDLNSSLNVAGRTDLNDELTVANGSSTHLTGKLTVDGAIDMKNILNVDGATTLNNTLKVTQKTTLEDLEAKTMDIKSDNAAFVATIENVNSGNSDGLLIKLGRTHGAWDGSTYLNVDNPAVSLLDGPMNTVQGWLNGGSFNASDILNFIPSTVIKDGLVSVTNNIFNAINGLPDNFPSVDVPKIHLLNSITFFPGLNKCTPQACETVCDPTGLLGCWTVCVPPWQVCVDIPKLQMPSLDIPAFHLIGPINNILPELPNIPGGDSFGLTIPKIPSTVVNNSLTKENEYITFQDKDGRKTGTIRALSTEDFRNNTILDNVYVMNVASKFIGIDLLDGFVSGTVKITNLINDFNNLGVEYSSGHGDYAEWLERIDPEEYLTAGDIVAVKGGKITKELKDAEQLMVVSHKPIILGNAPEEDKAHLGNNIAFMGQVPVKVVGSVKSGDYIVANAEIKGYGVAKHPEDMTAESYQLTVGRSWENNPAEGPKIVNTVVGVHSGDNNISIRKLQKEQQQLDNKIENLESRLNRISQIIEQKKDEVEYVSQK